MGLPKSIKLLLQRSNLLVLLLRILIDLVLDSLEILNLVIPLTQSNNTLTTLFL